MNNRNKFYNFEKVYIENKIKNHINTKRILSNLRNTNIEYIPDIKTLLNKSDSVLTPYERSKILFLSSMRGKILQKCPGSHGHICCNYYVINQYIGCPLNCTYCILQYYLNQPCTVINVDLETVFSELKIQFENNQNKLYRIGTGELSDSLVYDPITEFSKDYINFFSNFNNCIFEFKTKTDFIDNIISIKAPKNIVVGFSVNPEIIINNEEGESAGIDKRIAAMRKLVSKGYKISLHFDPIINIKNFENEYDKLINKIFSDLPVDMISWISLGTFRYNTELKNRIEFIYPDTKIIYDEFVECYDKKFRYFKPIRLTLYKKIINSLRKIKKDLLIYLCMESPGVWSDTLGFLPSEEKKVDLIFKGKII